MGAAEDRSREQDSGGVDRASGSESIMSDSDDQYLTFLMAGEEYGVDILCVQEIRGWDSATPIPNAPAHVKGVINLRGTIVPIIDLRQCFGLDEIEYTSYTVVIVLKVEMNSASRIVGIVVDAVSDVYSLSQDSLKEAPDLGDSVNTDYIRGLANVDEKIVILLEIECLLNMTDVSNLSGITKEVLKTAQMENIENV